MKRVSYDFSRLDLAGEAGARYLSDFARVEDLYACDYRNPDALARHANRLLNRTWRTRFDRARVADLLDKYAREHRAPQPVRDSIEKLRNRNSVCVITGQQAGLGGGPLLVLYKAVSVLLLARELEQASGLPVVPIFWNASDDSDLEEVNRFRALHEGKIGKFRFRMEAGRRPVRDVVMPKPSDPQWGDLAAIVPDGPHAQRALALLRDGAGRDFGSAFTRLLNELLGSRGLVVIEPKALVPHPAWKRLIVFELERREENRQALRRAADRLDARGAPAGVKITNHLNLFRLVNGERRHVTCEGSRLLVDGVEGSISKTALLAELRRAPGDFIPNVLLRPLVQSAIFPTVAYVGGPAEIGYHGLLKGLHRLARVFMPALFPRASLTLVRPEDEPRFAELLAFRARLHWRQEEATIVFEEAQRGVRDSFSALRAELKSLASPLEQEIARLETRNIRAVGEIRGRVKHHPLALMDGGAEFESLLRRYFPEGLLQERMLTVAGVYAEHGPGLVELVESGIDVFDFHHVALVP